MMKTSTASPFASLAIITLSIVAAALLVNSNKVLLENDIIPGQSAALTACHYFITFISLRVTRSPVVESNVDHKYKTVKIFMVALIGSFGVVCGNLVLQLSSVSFHQLSRLISLPGGILCDYVLHSRFRSFRELTAVLILAYAVCQFVSGDPTASWLGLFFAVLSVASMLGSAAAIKHTCSMYCLSPIDFSYLAAPFGVLSSGIWWTFWTLTDGASERNLNRDHLNDKWLKMFFFNCGLAVVVNITSTWCAAHCSTLLYALLGQCKMLMTIALSSYFFDDKVSTRGWILLGVGLSAFFCFTQAETVRKSVMQQSTGLLQRSADLMQTRESLTSSCFLNSVLLCSAAAAIFATFLKGPSQSIERSFAQDVSTLPSDHIQSDLTDSRFPVDWNTSSEALKALRKIQSSGTESHFHEATHVLHDLRSFLGDRPAKYLEIGSFTGVSASLMLTHPFPTSVTAVDPCVLDPSIFNGVLNQEYTIKARLARHAPLGCGLRSPWKLKVGFSPVALPIEETFDIIFIDGDHSTRAVWDDYLNTVGLLRPGGFMVFDDYLDYLDSGEVRGAVDEIALSTNLTSIGVLKNHHNIHPHLNQTGINEYIFQAKGKFVFGPHNVPYNIMPTLCVTVATYRRKDGSSPAKLTKLWKVLERQTYTHWRLYLTGDHYDNENEWRSLPFVNDQRVKMFNLPEPGERGKLEEGMMWMNAGLGAMNDAITRLLQDGFQWAVHLDDDDHWDADHLQNIVAGIRTGATFVMTSSQHFNGFLPPEVSIPYAHISNTVFPRPCQIPYSAVAFNAGLLRSRYETTEMPADANLWARIIFDDGFYPAYVPVISSHHADEADARGGALIVRKFLLKNSKAPAGWSADDNILDYTALATDYFPEILSTHCTYVIGPRLAKHGFRALRVDQIPYFVRAVTFFENMTVWGKN